MLTSISGDIKAAWLTRRNRILASPRFRDWAARFALTRGVARARARSSFDLVAGFVYSQTLSACVESGMLDLLAQGAATPGEIAAHCDLPDQAIERLLRAAEPLDLVERIGRRYVLGSTGAALQSDPGVVAMIAHHRLLYADLADPLALLRRGTGELAEFWPYGHADPTRSATYSALMAASQPMVAAQAVAAYDFTRHRRMLDVGGGTGAFASAIARAAPRLARAVFDLPDVVAGIADAKVERFAGSFADSPVPTGFDLITLVRVVHDHDDVVVAALLRSIRAALAPGARLLIVEPMSVRGARRMADAYFGFYLLAMGSGQARTPARLCTMLEEAGFSASRLLRTPQPVIASAIVAHA